MKDNVEHSEIRAEPRPRCVLCGNNGRPLYQDLVDVLFGTPGKWDLKACGNGNCDLIWLDPSPLRDDLPLLYRNYFFSLNSPAGQKKLALSIRAACYAAYKAGVYFPAAILGLQKSKYKMKHLYLDDLPVGLVFDVGCGDGSFLHRMQSRGWVVDGIDFDYDAIQGAKLRYGLDLRFGDLLGSKVPSDAFDAVTLNHVIEHVTDPVALLRETKRILKPDGRLIIVTPNSKSLGHRKFKMAWVNLDPPRHLQIFSPDSLRECARLSGLRVVSALTSAANADSFAGASYGVSEYYRHHRIGCPETTVNLKRAIMSLIFQFREFLNLRHDPHAGDEAVLICQK